MLFSLSLSAQDSSSNLIKFFKVELATHKPAVQLKWTMAGEITDSVRVVVERSADGQRFHMLEKLAPFFAGADSNYMYTDELPLSDSNFYRVSYISNKGAYNSVVQKANFFSRPKVDITIMPNPVFNNASVILQTEETGDIHFLLLDLNGKTIRTYQFKKSTGYAQHILDMYNVPKGEYILSIRSATINESRRIRKQ